MRDRIWTGTITVMTSKYIIDHNFNAKPGQFQPDSKKAAATKTVYWFKVADGCPAGNAYCHCREFLSTVCQEISLECWDCYSLTMIFFYLLYSFTRSIACLQQCKRKNVHKMSTSTFTLLVFLPSLFLKRWMTYYYFSINYTVVHEQIQIIILRNQCF